MSPTGRFVTSLSAAAAFGVIAAIALSRQRRHSDRLFLYAEETDRYPFPRTGVASLNRNHFRVQREYASSAWTFVIAAANGKNKWLFLRNSTTRAAATAWLDQNHTLRIAQYYPPGALDFPFREAAVDGRGYLLLAGALRNGSPLLSFAQVLEDGAFTEWWRSEVPGFPQPRDGWLRGLRSGHIWFVNQPEDQGGSTVYIFDVKTGTMLSTREFTSAIGGFVVDGNLVYIYFTDPLKTTELCMIDSQYRLITLGHKQFDFDFYEVPFNSIVSTPGAHLQYTYQGVGADGAIQVLTSNGFTLTTRLTGIDWRWHYMVPC